MNTYKDSYLLRIISILFFMLFMHGCEVSEKNHVEATNDSSIIPVSLVKVLVNPEEIEGKSVVTFGYMDFSGATMLFLTKQHALASDFTSSIRLADETKGGIISQSSCIGTYVYVYGIVSHDSYGLYGLSRINKIIDTSTGKICWKNE